MADTFPSHRQSPANLGSGHPAGYGFLDCSGTVRRGAQRSHQPLIGLAETMLKISPDPPRED